MRFRPCWACLLLALTIAYLAVRYEAFSGRSAGDRMRETMAANFAEAVASELPRLEPLAKIGIGDFENDEQGVLTDAIHQTLSYHDLRPHYLNSVSRFIPGRYRFGFTDSADENSLQSGRRAGWDYVLIGTVESWRLLPHHQAKLRVRLQLISVELGKVIFDEIIESNAQPLMP